MIEYKSEVRLPLTEIIIDVYARNSVPDGLILQELKLARHWQSLLEQRVGFLKSKIIDHVDQ
jgi:hypothetical protein